MIVVIDGYNLLKAIFPEKNAKFAIHRKQLIKELGLYKKSRQDTIKEMVLVFDGGYWGRATREVREGVQVIFSGQKQNADQWIIDYIKQNKEKEIMLVSRDRELIEKCKGHNVGVLKGIDFYEIMQKKLCVAKEVQKYTEKAHKYEHGKEGKVRDESIDILMEQAFVGDYKKDDFLDAAKRKQKGSSRTISKKEKKQQSRLKKL